MDFMKFSKIMLFVLAFVAIARLSNADLWVTSPGVYTPVYSYYSPYYSYPVYSYYSPYYSYYTYYPAYYSYYYYPYYSYYPVNEYFAPAQNPTYNINVQSTTSQPACSDGTASGSCSVSNSSLYCNDGNLVYNPEICGCPSGLVYSGGQCVQPTCSDGTLYGSCSTNAPYYCDNGNLIQKASQCGCPSNEAVKGDSCVSTNPYCLTSVNPSTVVAGSSSIVSLIYTDYPSTPSQGYVDCGNGQYASLNCQGNTSGTCTATCQYGSEGYYPFPVKISSVVGSVQCSGSSLSVVPAPLTTGSVLIKVYNGTQPLSNAEVYIGNSTPFYTDANGEVELQGLNPGVYTVYAADGGFQSSQASVQVTAGNNAVAQITLTPSTCDIASSIVSNVAGVPNPVVQLNLNNNADYSQNISISYSSVFPVSGPLSVVVNAGSSVVVSVQPELPTNFYGSSELAVTFAGDCSTTQLIPLALNSGVSVSALNENATVFPNNNAVFNFLVQNNADFQTTVSMASDSVFSSSFSESQFSLQPHEAKYVSLTVQVPDGASGSQQIGVNATTPFGSNEAFVDLNVPGQFYSSSSCNVLNDSGVVFVPFNVTNYAASGDFNAVVKSDFGAELTQGLVYDFQYGSTRTLYLKFDSSKLAGSQDYATVELEHNGTVVFQQSVCVEVNGFYSAIASLSQSEVNSSGSLQIVFLTVQNTGSYPDSYYVQLNSNLVAANPSNFSLQPGQTAQVELDVYPRNSPVGSYIVPITVYSFNNGVVSTVNLVVNVEPQLFSLNANLSNVNYSNGVFNLTFTVQNSGGDEYVSPSIQGLPNAWSYSFQPTSAFVPSGLAVNFTALVNAPGVSNQDYNASLVLSTQSNSTAVPFTIPVRSNSLLSGFFTLVTEPLVEALILVLVIVGVFFIYEAWSERNELKLLQ